MDKQDSMIHNRWQRLQEKIANIDELDGGAPGIVLGALRSFGRAEGGDAAAGQTFYAVFSLFPLLSIAVSVASLLAGPAQVTGLLMAVLGRAFPVSYDVIQQAVQGFVKARGTINLVSLVSLLWAASGGFAILLKHINRAWENAPVRNFLQGRLMGLGLVVGILLLMVLVLLVSLMLSVIVQMNLFIPPLVPLLFSPLSGLWLFLLRALPFFIAFFVVLFLYRFLPTTRVHYRDAFWGALITSVAWALSSTLFGLYIGASMNRLSLLYGPVAALAVLMIWIYLNNLIILFGAHLSAAVARRRMKREMPKVTLA